jgi:dephospho-CoA kinase
MLRVGLTGGIATGKTRALTRFAAAGFRTLDLDRVSREVMAPGGSAYADVVEAFGRGILAADGSVDRRALGHVVFADAAARRRLERIVHPRIREAEAALLSAGGGPVAVVDAALLVETGTHLRFDRLVVVYCDPQEQLCRLMARDGITERAARARIDAQMPGEQKRGFAHFVIDTSDSLAATDSRADEVVAAVRAVASAPPSRVRIPPERAAALVDRGPHEGPRGITPWGLVEAIAAAGTLDLARLAGRLDPPHDGPWYQAPETAAADQPPESLAAPVAIWASGRRPGDAPFTVAAAASLARLTHLDGCAVAGAILAALAAQHALATGDPASLRREVPEWISAATRWTGVAPPAPVADTVLAAAAHPGDRESAARAAQVAGGLPTLARALAGGPVTGGVAPARVEQVARLLAAVRAG